MTENPAAHPPAADWRDSKTWYMHETFVARIVRFLGRYGFDTLTRVERIGLENIPASGPCIVAANHIHNLDVIYLGAAIARYPHFMAKRELYKNPLMGWLIRQLGSFPVNRGARDAWALRQAGKILDEGLLLFMFPEGTRNSKAQLRKGKFGAVKLALEHGAVIVPATILGTNNLRWGISRPSRVRMEFAPPLDVVKMAGDPPYTNDTYRALTTTLMHTIAAMLPPENRGVYGDANATED